MYVSTLGHLSNHRTTFRNRFPPHPNAAEISARRSTVTVSRRIFLPISQKHIIMQSSFAGLMDFIIEVTQGLQCHQYSVLVSLTFNASFERATMKAKDNYDRNESQCDENSVPTALDKKPKCEYSVSKTVMISKSIHCHNKSRHCHNKSRLP